MVAGCGAGVMAAESIPLPQGPSIPPRKKIPSVTSGMTVVV